MYITLTSVLLHDSIIIWLSQMTCLDFVLPQLNVSYNYITN